MYDPRIHHRQSTRLRGYDYAKAGLYFITICCHNRLCLFGDVVGGMMILNDAGKNADDCWMEIPAHFPNVTLHEYVIMPNHVHGIIELIGGGVGVKNISPLHRHPRSPSKTIGSIVRGYKIGVTKWFRNNTDVQNVWQRNYYDHIIRDENSFEKISAYIRNNPSKWDDNKFCLK